MDMELLMSKKGFLLYELFISFGFIMIIMIIMLQTTVNLKNRQLRIMKEAKINTFNNDIIRSFGSDLKALKISSVTGTASPFTITYASGKVATLIAPSNQSKVTYDGITYDRIVAFISVTHLQKTIGTKTYHIFKINSNDAILGNLTLIGST